MISSKHSENLEESLCAKDKAKNESIWMFVAFGLQNCHRNQCISSGTPPDIHKVKRNVKKLNKWKAVLWSNESKF